MKKYYLILIILLFGILLMANMKNDIVNSLSDKNIPNWLVVVLIATLPIFELRGSIPIAIHVFHFNIFYSYILSFIGNLLPIIPILLFLEYIYTFFSKWHFTERIFNRFFESTKKRTRQIERYKMIGLITFVAIPLPITGAWTGAIASVLFGMKFRESILSIIIGVCVAGIIVTLLSIIGIWGAIIAGFAIICLIIISLLKVYR